jgi:hypothetical protein
MHPTQDLFFESFSYVLQFDMHFTCTPMWTKFYSCKKWVLQQVSTLTHFWGVREDITTWLFNGFS